jgi:hypothetical protein
MENKAMERTLYRVLRKTGVHREQISPDASFDDDLNFDQLDWTLLIIWKVFLKSNLKKRKLAGFRASTTR